MTIRILSPEELAVRRAAGGAYKPYVEVLAQMEPGQGGEILVADEGVSRQMVKNRVVRAAASLSKPIAFVRSGEDTVIFEVTAAPEPRRRRRPAKATK